MTLAELKKTVGELADQCMMPEYQEKVSEIFRSQGITVRNGRMNTIDLFEELSILGVEKVDDMVSQISDLAQNYSYDEFFKTAEKHQHDFIMSRTSNLLFRVSSEITRDVGYIPSKDACVQSLEDFITIHLKDVDPLPLGIHYEDEHGEKFSRWITHKEDVLAEGYVETKPISRLVGDYYHTLFTKTFFWDRDREEWFGVYADLIEDVLTVGSEESIISRELDSPVDDEDLDDGDIDG